MSPLSPTPADVITFLQQTFARTGVTHAVIAISGGIDSAVSLSLLTRALPAANIHPLLLPYGAQNMDDARAICAWNKIPDANITTVNIEEFVATFAKSLAIPDSDVEQGSMRRGNIMARCRMIVVYDFAKKLNALVVGTENKSEHYLGYFTRFGDAASDIEPIAQWYKTQVREVARELGVPDQFLTKAPSAGLWTGQTDETELGFTYEQADRVLTELIDNHVPPEQIAIADISADVIAAVAARVKSQAFKLQVPYLMEE